jgi:hypothetical protein
MLYRRIIYRLSGLSLFYLRHRDRLLRLPIWLGVPILLPLDYAVRAVRRRTQVLIESENVTPAETA